MRISHLVGEQESGIGTRRAMQHELGFRFEECVTLWLDGEGYVFDVVKVPWPMGVVTESWRMDDKGTTITVTTRVDYGMKLGPLGVLFDCLLLRFIVRREMRSGVCGLKQYAEPSSEPL